MNQRRPWRSAGMNALMLCSSAFCYTGIMRNAPTRLCSPAQQRLPATRRRLVAQRHLMAGASQLRSREALGASDLGRKVMQTLSDRCGLQLPASLLVGVSGGSDSTALMLLLDEVKEEHAADGENMLSINVIHFDHGLRAESKEEAKFVESLARKRGMPFYLRVLEEADAARFRETPSGMHDFTRKWRRETMKEVAAEIRKQSHPSVNVYLVSAHHADDQVETVLMKLLRGAHISKLHGMRYRDEQDPPLLRPLLDVSKEELVHYLRGMGQEWREDLSNHEPKYKRNRVRLQLIPLLEELCGGKEALAARMNGLSHQSMQLQQWMEEVEPPLPQGPRPGKRSLPLAMFYGETRELLRNSILHQFICSEAGELNLRYSHLLKIAEQLTRHPHKVEWSMDVGKGWQVVRSGPLLMVEREGEEELRGSVDMLSDVDVNVEVDGPWSVMVVEGDSAPPAAEGRRRVLASDVCFTLHNVPAGSSLIVRTKRAGDRFIAKWQSKDQKLKDFLRAQRVPVNERDEIPLVCISSRPPATSSPSGSPASPSSESVDEDEATVVAVSPKYVAKFHSVPNGNGLTLSLRIM